MSDVGRRQSSAGGMRGHSVILARMMILPLALALVAVPQAAAPAPPPPVACATTDTDLPAPLAGWATTGTGMAMDRAFQLPATGGAADAAFTIANGGRYRVALDQGGWIDLVRDGKPLTSVAHGHGPNCTTIRKIVDFDLTPGSYTLKLTKLTKAQAKVMLVAPQKE
jgi:hypothetical protein